MRLLRLTTACIPYARLLPSQLEKRSHSSGLLSRRRAFSTAVAPLVTSVLGEDGVAVLTLNSPAKMNALSEAMGDEFSAAITELRALPPPSLRAVVLTGALRAIFFPHMTRLLRNAYPLKLRLT